MKKIFETRFGSQVYGTSTPNSDTDYKGVYIPEARELLLQRASRTSVNYNTKRDPTAKNTAGDVDAEFFTLQAFLRLCAEGQTVALDMLFTPEEHWLVATPEWHSIIKNRGLLVHRGVSAFVGYCQTQAAKYGIKGSRMRTVKEAIAFLNDFPDDMKLFDMRENIRQKFESMEHIAWPTIKGPNGVETLHWEVCNRKIALTASVKYARQIFQKVYDQYGHRAKMAETNDGVDWKALYHAVRVCHEAKELLKTGSITFPRPEAALLLDIRNGKLEYSEVAGMIERGIDEVKELQKTSNLPESIDIIEFWEDFVFQVYKNEVKGPLTTEDVDRALSKAIKEFTI